MDRFLIGQFTTGLQKNVSAFLSNEDAFETLRNAYVYQSRVRKRFGTDLLVPSGGVVAGFEALGSRLRFKLASKTDAVGALSLVIPNAPFVVGASVSISNGVLTELFTVSQLGTPAALLKSGAATLATLNTTTGALVITGSIASSDAYFYPALPAMGLITKETKNINNEPLYAFDTKRSYYYTADGWDALDATVWTGSDTDFFWGETHRGATSADDILFVTNNNTTDGIKYWDGTAWVKLNPLVTVAGTIEAALIVISFKNRLLLLNTTEVLPPLFSKNFQNRCRWSQNGTPISTIATPTDVWREDIPGKGGYIDLPTQEVITSAQHLKDRLIVTCERSSWELVYTSNPILPFVWQQISTELGVESSFSQVPFDQAIIGMGNVGIHACDGNSVKRIDEKIPDKVYEIHNVDGGIKRVCAIRDYRTEQIYFSYPSTDRTAADPYPDEILVYNYNTGTWAIFDDSVTTWGHTQEGLPTGYVKESRHVVGGNQQGFIFIVNRDKPTNSPSMQISNIAYVSANNSDLTIKNHNLSVGDWIKIENCIGSTLLNNVMVKVVDIGNTTANVVTVFSSGIVPLAGYKGGGTATRVSKVDVVTKQFVPYQQNSMGSSISEVRFLVDKTTSGEVEIDWLLSSSDTGTFDDSETTGTLLGSGSLSLYAEPLVPYEARQNRLWHTAFIDAEGDCVQLRLNYSDKQFATNAKVECDFQLHAMILSMSPIEIL